MCFPNRASYMSIFGDVIFYLCCLSLEKCGSEIHLSEVLRSTSCRRNRKACCSVSVSGMLRSTSCSRKACLSVSVSGILDSFVPRPLLLVTSYQLLGSDVNSHARCPASPWHTLHPLVQSLRYSPHCWAIECVLFVLFQVR